LPVARQLLGTTGNYQLATHNYFGVFMQRRHLSSRRGGFTLIELLVVIGIILLLISILMPVVSRVRLAAYDASTQSQMQRIMQACESYYHDWNSYPGPVPNTQLAGAAPTTPIWTISTTGGGTIGPTPEVTSSENLVLGLLGLINPPSSSTPAPLYNTGTGTTTLLPPAHDVLSLSALRPASYHYIDYVPAELSAGSLNTTEGMAAVPASDTIIPEFIDRFPDPLPILYMRANVGGNDTPAVNNQDLGTNNQFVQYNFMELSPYGCNVPMSSGPSAQLKLDTNYFTTLQQDVTMPGLSSDVQTPYTDYNGTTAVANSSPTAYDGWLTNPNIGGGASPTTTGGTPRGKDGFILISAGKDRVYGTHDDTFITP
jgi:prepilin-type N-terminal cleavage/methylation domain-containing protein